MSVVPYLYRAVFIDRDGDPTFVRSDLNTDTREHRAFTFDDQADARSVARLCALANEGCSWLEDVNCRWLVEGQVGRDNWVAVAESRDAVQWTEVR